MLYFVRTRQLTVKQHSEMRNTHELSSRKFEECYGPGRSRLDCPRTRTPRDLYCVPLPLLLLLLYGFVRIETSMGESTCCVLLVCLSVLLSWGHEGVTELSPSGVNQPQYAIQCTTRLSHQVRCPQSVPRLEKDGEMGTKRGVATRQA